MLGNQNQSYDDGVYYTPQDKIDAINRSKNLQPAIVQYESEYLYADNNFPRSPETGHCETVQPQSRATKHISEDFEDEDGYTLARDVGWKADRDEIRNEKSVEDKVHDSSNDNKNRCCSKKCIIGCLIVVLLLFLGIGGILAYMLTKQLGIIFLLAIHKIDNN